MNQTKLFTLILLSFFFTSILIFDIPQANAQTLWYSTSLASDFDNAHRETGMTINVNYSVSFKSIGNGGYLYSLVVYGDSASIGVNVTSGILGAGIWNYTSHTVIEYSIMQRDFSVTPLVYGDPSSSASFHALTFDFSGNTYLDPTNTYLIGVYVNSALNTNIQYAVKDVASYGSFSSYYGVVQPPLSWGLATANRILIGSISTLSTPTEGFPVSCTFSQGTGGNIYYHGGDSVNHGAGTYSLPLGDLLVVYMSPYSGYYSGYFDFNNGTKLYQGDQGTGVDVNGKLYIIMTVTSAFNCTAYFSNTPLTPSNETVDFVLDTVGMGSATWQYDTGGTSFPSGIYQTYHIIQNRTVVASTTTLSGYHLSYWSFNNGTFIWDDGSGMLSVKLTVDTHLTAVFVSDSEISPTRTPSGIWTFNLPKLKTDATSLFEMIIGVILLVCGIGILLRAQSAWGFGLILFIAGFFLQIITNPVWLTLIAIAIEAPAALFLLMKRDHVGKNSK